MTETASCPLEAGDPWDSRPAAQIWKCTEQPSITAWSLCCPRDTGAHGSSTQVAFLLPAPGCCPGEEAGQAVRCCRFMRGEGLSSRCIPWCTALCLNILYDCFDLLQAEQFWELPQRLFPGYNPQLGLNPQLGVEFSFQIVQRHSLPWWPLASCFLTAPCGRALALASALGDLVFMFGERNSYLRVTNEGSQNNVSTQANQTGTV